MMSAWLMLRQAEEALRGGRLEEAVRLINEPHVCGHKKAEALRSRLSRAYLERARQHCRHGDWRAAWKDLAEAEQCGCHGEDALRLQEDLQRRGLDEARRLLEARDPQGALEVVEQLRGKGMHGPELSRVEQAAKDWQVAERLAGRGEFGPALAMLERIPAFSGDAVRNAYRDWKRRQSEYVEVVRDLYEAVEKQRWQAVIELADRVLSLAPEHPEAARLRAKAWQALEPPTLLRSQPRPVPERAGGEEPERRFVLWIDGVGGYLICLADRISLGQAAVDVPLLADVSRLHAYLVRDAESYSLEALRPTRLNGKETNRAVLSDGDEITLGNSCRLRFRLPVEGSLTARLEFASDHRLPLNLDGIILMAESCLLGPEGVSHLEVPDVAETIALFRGPNRWEVRASGELNINGTLYHNHAVIPLPGTVSGSAFRFTLEPLHRGGLYL
ncbi:MAG: hypothetical protein NZM31_10435 [Gemmatales bacterium]|nr:hypothetical protein [Gemmatales bacterium]MDW8387413.1 hypothetical protein [Gemmatales bacterium]